MISAHSHYQIGSSHKFCEDFALHGSGGESGFAIVCDGCSSSGIRDGIRHPINVDFGARLLPILVRQSLREIGLDFLCIDKEGEEPNIATNVRDKLFQVLFPKIKSTFSTMNIPYSVLDTTLLIAGMNENKSGVLCIGDGAVACLSPEGFWNIYIIEYESNAPYYISYMLEEERANKYKEEFGENKINVKIFSTKDFKNILDLQTLTFESEEPVFIPNYNASKIVLFSDGIETFGTIEERKRGICRSVLEPMSKLLDFPHIKGEFVTKRFNVLNQWSKKNELTHTDDLSMAVVGRVIEGE